MTNIQKTYKEIIEGISGENWRIDDTWKEGNAGVAVAVSVLDDGSTDLTHLKRRIPHFTQTEIRASLNRLKRNGYLRYDRKQKGYQIVVDEDVSIEDGIFWSLLANVANGLIKRAPIEKK